MQYFENIKTLLVFTLSGRKKTTENTTQKILTLKQDIPMIALGQV